MNPHQNHPNGLGSFSSGKLTKRGFHWLHQFELSVERVDVSVEFVLLLYEKLPLLFVFDQDHLSFLLF